MYITLVFQWHFLGLGLGISTLFICRKSKSLKWRSDIYACFLSGSVQFFVFTLLFFVSCLISSSRRGRGTAHYALREGGGLPAGYAQEWLTLLRHSPWLWLVLLSVEWWILANQITATGWSHRQLIFTQLTCILFYCQIIMTILANITKKCYRL